MMIWLSDSVGMWSGREGRPGREYFHVASVDEILDWRIRL